jgi:hypothetical protein
LKILPSSSRTARSSLKRYPKLFPKPPHSQNPSCRRRDAFHPLRHAPLLPQANDANSDQRIRKRNDCRRQNEPGRRQPRWSACRERVRGALEASHKVRHRWSPIIRAPGGCGARWSLQQPQERPPDLRLQFLDRRRPIPQDLQALIQRMAAENRLWGQKRIQAELARLGFEVSARNVAKYMSPRHGRGPSPGWREFLRRHESSIWACDFFCVRTILFQNLYVFFWFGTSTEKFCT